MATAYMICAVVGGTILVCQFLLTLLGLGGEHGDMGGAHGHDFGGHDIGDHDVGHDGTGGDHNAHGHPATTWLFGVLTLRTLVAGLAFFGLTGLALQNNTDTEPALILLAAGAAGITAIFIVHWVMRSLTRLNVDGTVRIQKAVGASGTVYLTVPGSKRGVGKVHVQVSDRLMEYKAVTAQEDLPTGVKVVVVNIIGSDTVEVSKA
jgi:hypothetical protein